MGLSCTVSEIDGDFHRNYNQIFLPLYFCALAEWVPSELGTGAVVLKTRMMVLYTGPIKKFDDIFSHLDTVHQRDRRTDTGRQATAKTALTLYTHSVAR